MNESSDTCCNKCNRPIDSAMRVHHRGAVYHVDCFEDSPLVCAGCKNTISAGVQPVMHNGAYHHRLCADTVKRDELLKPSPSPYGSALMRAPALREPLDAHGGARKELVSPSPNALTPAEQARADQRPHIRDVHPSNTTPFHARFTPGPLGTREVLADEVDEDPPHQVDDIAFCLFATDPEFRKEFGARTEYTGDQTAAMREVWRKADDIVIRDGVAHAKWPKLAEKRLAAYERARMMCALQVG